MKNKRHINPAIIPKIYLLFFLLLIMILSEFFIVEKSIKSNYIRFFIYFFSGVLYHSFIGYTITRIKEEFYYEKKDNKGQLWFS